jgi:hypothetical protein
VDRPVYVRRRDCYSVDAAEHHSSLPFPREFSAGSGCVAQGCPISPVTHLAPPVAERAAFR